ncbi:MAG: signal recognition particle protein [Legionellales bacterium]|nr:signal recognition particle protein [Legionellales bacterium]
MFANLSDRLTRITQKLKGHAKLTEENIQASLREIRMSLLEADVALPVVKSLIEDIKQAALGRDVMSKINPGQALIKIVNDELIQLMGQTCEPLNLAGEPPTVILMAGLQGAGKTTTVAKLAHLLQQDKKSVMVTSTDIYRPAAIEQLRKLATDIQATFYPSQTDQSPVAIAQQAIDAARRQHTDVVIIDTAGRLHIDEAMMDEIKQLHQAVNPAETLFIVDSMTGQDAANTAQAFNDTLPLTGVILTKVDGDARGGAALSVKYLTGKPIKFLGTGEKIDGLEAFHPDRVVSRILGMGDIVTLVEQAERKLDKQKSEKLAKKIRKGQGFDLSDFRDQLQQMNQMGGMGGLLNKMPGMGMGGMPKHISAMLDDKMVKKIIAVIDSMTLHERAFPDIISGSRKRRIAKGSGTEPADVNRLLKQYKQMQKMMKKFKPGKMKNMMRSLPGNLPPNMLPKDFE